MIAPRPYQYQYRHIGTYHPQFQSVYKQVRGDEHLYRKLDAWSWDKEALDYWAELGAESLTLEDLDTGCVYHVEMEIMMEDGVPIKFGAHGLQLALPRSLWDMIADPGASEIDDFDMPDNH